jgi:2-methylcitrate dehydratase PrpD
VFGRGNLSKFFDPVPKSVTDAQFSVPYLAAMLLLRQPRGYEWYTEENMHSPEARALASKVQFIADAEAEACYSDLSQPVRVCIDLQGSRSVETAISVARGDPRRPLTAQDVGNKFLSLVTPVLGATAAKQMLGLVEDLEQLEDAARLAEFFASTPGNSIFDV